MYFPFRHALGVHQGALIKYLLRSALKHVSWCDAVQRLVIALDLGLGLWVIRRATGMLDVLLLQPTLQLATGERERSTRPAMQVLTAGTARACIHDLMLPRPLSGRSVAPDTPFILLILS